MSLARATGHSIGGKQKYPPTEAHLARHPSMHRTDTLDMFTLAYAEIYLMTHGANGDFYGSHRMALFGGVLNGLEVFTAIVLKHHPLIKRGLTVRACSIVTPELSVKGNVIFALPALGRVPLGPVMSAKRIAVEFGRPALMSGAKMFVAVKKM